MEVDVWKLFKQMKMNVDVECDVSGGTEPSCKRGYRLWGFFGEVHSSRIVFTDYQLCHRTWHASSKSDKLPSRQLEQDLEATQGMNAEVSSEVTSAVQRVLSSVAVGAVTSHIEHNVSTDVPTSAPNNTFTGMSSEGVVATGDSGIDGESTSPSVEGLNTNDDRQPTDQLEKQTPPVIERSPPPRSDPLSARRTVRLSTSSYVIELLPESSCWEGACSQPIWWTPAAICIWASTLRLE